MMNKNDYHYVMRRIITFLLISALSFFLFQSCAKAEVISSEWSTIKASSSQYADATGRSGDIAFSQAVFQNRGQGYVIFQVYAAPLANDQNNDPIYGISVTDNQSIWECEISTNIWYVDNHTQRHIINVKCPVQIGANGLRSWKYQRGNDGHLFLKTSDYITFVGDASDASTIVSGINSQIQAQISAGNTNAQTISNAINTATQSEINAINSQSQQQHTDSQAEQQAINDNTQAINDLNDTINADYTYDPNMEDLTYFFDNNDQNIIRSLLLLPFNILGYMITILSSNTCYDVSLGTLYGTNITMPCIWIVDYIGVQLYDLIDTIFTILISLGMVAYLFKVLRKVFTVSNSTCETCGVEVFK